jgi:hypothetical protein
VVKMCKSVEEYIGDKLGLRFELGHLAFKRGETLAELVARFYTTLNDLNKYDTDI